MISVRLYRVIFPSILLTARCLLSNESATDTTGSSGGQLKTGPSCIPGVEVSQNERELPKKEAMNPPSLDRVRDPKSLLPLETVHSERMVPVSMQTCVITPMKDRTKMHWESLDQAMWIDVIKTVLSNSPVCALWIRSESMAAVVAM